MYNYGKLRNLLMCTKSIGTSISESHIQVRLLFGRLFCSVSDQEISAGRWVITITHYAY